MIVVGLLVLLAVGGMGIAGITTHHGRTRSSPFRHDVPGYHLQARKLFFFGLPVGALAMLGLSTIVAGLGRGFRLRPASRQLLTGSRQPTSALHDHNDQVMRPIDWLRDASMPRKGQAATMSAAEGDTTGVVMSIAAGIALIVLGAILTFAVKGGHMATSICMSWVSF